MNNESLLADVQTIRAHLTAVLGQQAVIYVAVSCHQLNVCYLKLLKSPFVKLNIILMT